jgi:hypothetical protein
MPTSRRAAARAGFRLGCPHRLSHQELFAMSTGWIVLGVIVILVLFAFGAYNRLVALGQRVSQAFADIDVQLKQPRSDPEPGRDRERLCRARTARLTMW